MDKKTRNIVIAGIGGIAVGAALGILFAPDEGKKTRAKLKKKADDLIDRGSEAIEAHEEILCSIKDKLESSLTNGKAELKDELIAQIEKLEAALKIK